MSQAAIAVTIGLRGNASVTEVAMDADVVRITATVAATSESRAVSLTVTPSRPAASASAA